MDLLAYAVRIIKTVPAVVPHLTGRARWMALTMKGGEGSGNFGHAGRPGLVGGSAPGGGIIDDAERVELFDKIREDEDISISDDRRIAGRQEINSTINN